MMTPQTKRLLRTIDTALAKGDQTSDELWKVLTALRGPDTSSSSVKERTTVHIRIAAFPRTAMANDTPASFDTDQPFTLGRGPRHFQNHIHSAADVLGLIRLKT